jgi:RimJ/RimL family protein N-acetyltransferase
MIIFRKITIEDIDQVMEIIEQGKVYLKSTGVDQWQNGYPNEAVIKEDLANGYGYVLECEDKIVGTVALSFDGEPYYDYIRDGKWMTKGDFLVIHRLAVSRTVRGTDIASEIIRQSEQLCALRGIRSIKIDTHKDNVVMQNFVKKNGFEYCGIVILGSEGERLAFEKLV